MRNRILPRSAIARATGRSRHQYLADADVVEAPDLINAVAHGDAFRALFAGKWMVHGWLGAGNNENLGLMAGDDALLHR